MFDAEKQHKKITPGKEKTLALVETFSPQLVPHIPTLGLNRPKGISIMCDKLVSTTYET